MIPQLKEIINDILKEKFRNNEEFFNELTNPQINKLNDAYLSMTAKDKIRMYKKDKIRMSEIVHSYFVF